MLRWEIIELLNLFYILQYGPASPIQSAALLETGWVRRALFCVYHPPAQQKKQKTQFWWTMGAWARGLTLPKCWEDPKILIQPIPKHPKCWEGTNIFNKTNPRAARMWNCPKFDWFLVWKTARMWNCPKFLNNPKCSMLKVWNCPKKLKKLKFSDYGSWGSPAHLPESENFGFLSFLGQLQGFWALPLKILRILGQLQVS